MDDDIVTRLRRMTDTDLADTFGPQWQHIVALIDRAEMLTDDEMNRLIVAHNAISVGAAGHARFAALDAAWYASRSVHRDLASEAASDGWYGARSYAHALAWEAVKALVVRDLIGKCGFTQARYDLLAGPWRSVIGPVHPDDEARPTPRPGERPMTRTHLEILAHLQIEADFVVDRAVVTRGQRLVLRDLLQQAHDVIDRLNDENEALRIDLAAAYCRMDDIEGLNDE